jgi:CubicO group peptidase (beta-lactamase class C family)
MLLDSTARLLLAATARQQRDARAPSLVAGIVRDGGLAWSAGRGDLPGDPADVQYRLGSITKTVTAIAVMRLRDEGLVGLDDPLDRHLSGTPFGDRSISALLSHLGGASSESPGGWWERTPGGALADLDLREEHAVLPQGRRFHYSNLGFGLLGELVATLRGRSWLEVVTDEVLLPLGMTRTTPRPDGTAAQGYAVHPWADVLVEEPEHDAGAMAPAGQLWSTLTDLAQLGVLLLGDTGGVLDPDTVEEMATPQAATDAEGQGSYGLGVQSLRSGGALLVGHGGSMPGFLAGLWVDRAEATGAMLLTNTTAGAEGSFAPSLLAILRDHEPRVVEAWAPAAPPVPLGALGPWYWGPSPLALTAIPGGLLHLVKLGRAARESRFRPHPTVDGAWLGLDGYYAGETLRFVGDPADPTAIDLATFVLTRSPYDPAAPVPGGGVHWD